MLQYIQEMLLKMLSWPVIAKEAKGKVAPGVERAA
jgi:hypothetical protein